MRRRLWLGLAWLLLARAPGAAGGYPHLEGDVRWRRLFSSTHFFLRVDPGGQVQGTRWRHGQDSECPGSRVGWNTSCGPPGKAGGTGWSHWSAYRVKLRLPIGAEFVQWGQEAGIPLLGIATCPNGDSCCSQTPLFGKWGERDALISGSCSGTRNGAGSGQSRTLPTEAFGECVCLDVRRKLG